MNYEDDFLDASETFYNTVDSAFFKKLYRIYLENYAGRTVSCARCPAHRGCNFNSGYKNRHSWKKWRKCQCKWVESKTSIKDMWEPEVDMELDYD